MEQIVRENRSAGHRAFIVPCYYQADGMMNFKMERMKQLGQQRLLELGLDVTGVTWDEWKAMAYFEVGVPEPREPEKSCPKCAETIKAAAVMCRFCGSDLSGAA